MARGQVAAPFVAKGEAKTEEIVSRGKRQMAEKPSPASWERKMPTKRPSEETNEVS